MTLIYSEDRIRNSDSVWLQVSYINSQSKPRDRTSIIMDLVLSLLLFSFLWTLVLVLTSNSRSRKSSKLPYPLPIIGNILELGKKPHKSLTKLSKKYGPIMSLKLGCITTVVASSPEIAKLVLQTNDLASSSRYKPSVVEAFGHDEVSVVWLPVQDQWRKLRKICKEHMFSVSRLDESHGLRKQKLEKLSDYVKECSRRGQVVDIGEAAFTTSLNLISATLFSKELAAFNSDTSYEMKDIVWSLMKCTSAPNLSDYFPFLKPIDPQGILKESKFYIEKLFAIFDRIIDEKLNSRLTGQKTDKCDLLEALLDLNQKDEPEISRNDIIHLLLDLFVAGTDTTSGTVEWAMTELLCHPEKMSRVRSEIRDVVGEHRQVRESDISNLPYLQAVVKETLRFHPPGPFLLPHKAESDIVLNEFIIPRNAQILVNIWAICKDSTVWPNADSFVPERFLDKDVVDFRGKDFELIPFGAGRRICPGLPLAYRMVHLTLATFVHNFDWKLEDGMTPQKIDMTEKFGLTLQKATPLKAIPVQL